MTADDAAHLRLLQTAWEEAIAEVDILSTRFRDFNLRGRAGDYHAACERERVAGRLYLALVIARQREEGL